MVPLLVVDARAQELAGALLGAPLATRVVQVEVERGRGGPPGGALPAPARHAPHHDRRGEHDRDQGENQKRQQHRIAPDQPPEARGKKITRSVSGGMSA
jgi:hypothetical protein